MHFIITARQVHIGLTSEQATKNIIIQDEINKTKLTYVFKTTAEEMSL